MKMFPILCGPGLRAIPWAMIEPYEANAKDNHDQSLEELARRGGLSPAECLAVLEGVNLRRMLATWTDETAAPLLRERVDAWMGKDQEERITALESQAAQDKARIGELEKAIGEWRESFEALRQAFHKHNGTTSDYLKAIGNTPDCRRAVHVPKVDR